MADRHTLEELNNCSREELITIVLMMQGQQFLLHTIHKRCEIFLSTPDDPVLLWIPDKEEGSLPGNLSDPFPVVFFSYGYVGMEVLPP